MKHFLILLFPFALSAQQTDTTWINDSVMQVTITYGEMNRKEFRLAKLQIKSDLKKAELEIDALKIQSRNDRIHIRNERKMFSKRLRFVSDSLDNVRRVELKKERNRNQEEQKRLKNEKKALSLENKKNRREASVTKKELGNQRALARNLISALVFLGLFTISLLIYLRFRKKS